MCYHHIRQKHLQRLSQNDHLAQDRNVMLRIGAPTNNLESKIWNLCFKWQHRFSFLTCHWFHVPQHPHPVWMVSSVEAHSFPWNWRFQHPWHPTNYLRKMCHVYSCLKVHIWFIRQKKFTKQEKYEYWNFIQHSFLTILKKTETQNQHLLDGKTAKSHNTQSQPLEPEVLCLSFLWIQPGWRRGSLKQPGCKFCI